VILLFVFRWGKVSQQLQQALRVEPRHPLQRRNLDVVEPAPGARLANELGLEQADHRFGQGVVVRVAPAAHRGLDARFRQPLG